MLLLLQMLSYFKFIEAGLCSYIFLLLIITYLLFKTI